MAKQRKVTAPHYEVAKGVIVGQRNGEPCEIIVWVLECSVCGQYSHYFGLETTGEAIYNEQPGDVCTSRKRLRVKR